MDEQKLGLTMFFFGLILIMLSNYAPIVEGFGLSPIKEIITFIGMALFVCGILLYKMMGKK